MDTDAAAYASLLQSTPRDHPDRPKILERLVWTYYRMEYESYQSCLELRTPDPGDETGRASFERYALRVVKRIRDARELSYRTCASLRNEHPGFVSRVPCDSTSSATKGR